MSRTAMRLRRTSGSVLLAATTAAFGGRAEALAQDFEIQATGGYYLLVGELAGGDFEEEEKGFGFEVVPGLAWPSGFQLGVGFGVSFLDTAEPGETIDFLTVFAQPAYRFGTGRVQPFAGVRGGYARTSSEQTPFGTDASSDGFTAGVVAGLELWLSDGFAFTGSVLLEYVSLGDVSVGNESIPDTDRTGVRPGVRFGINARLR